MEYLGTEGSTRPTSSKHSQLSPQVVSIVLSASVTFMPVALGMLSSQRQKLSRLHGSRIDASRIHFPENRLSAEGGLSTVSRAILLPSDGTETGMEGQVEVHPQHVAVKRMKIKRCENRNKVLGLALREADILLHIDHVNIMVLCGFVEDIDNDQVCLIFPWAENGNLRAFVAAANPGFLLRVQLLKDVICGLAHLHAQEPQICHGDLKAVNIVVNSESRAMITDFGSARRIRDSTASRDASGNKLSEENAQKPALKATMSEPTNTITFTLTTYNFTLRWAAPELLNEDRQTLETDIWSFGWVCYEIMTGRIPFENIKNHFTVALNIVEGKVPSLDDNAQLSLMRQLGSLMIRCWSIDPQDRPNAKACQTSLIDMSCWESEYWALYDSIHHSRNWGCITQSQRCQDSSWTCTITVTRLFAHTNDPIGLEDEFTASASRNSGFEAYNAASKLVFDHFVRSGFHIEPDNEDCQ